MADSGLLPVPYWKVLHAAMVPCCIPRLNHCVRWAELPCVNDSGLTRCLQMADAEPKPSERVPSRCSTSSRVGKIYKHDHRQILNRLSAAQVHIIGPGQNRRNLAHVPQLFRMARAAPALLPVGDVLGPQPVSPERAAFLLLRSK
jgi:hypothetical protein